MQKCTHENGGKVNKSKSIKAEKLINLGFCGNILTWSNKLVGITQHQRSKNGWTEQLQILIGE